MSINTIQFDGMQPAGQDEVAVPPEGNMERTLPANSFPPRG